MRIRRRRERVSLPWEARESVWGRLARAARWRSLLVWSVLLLACVVLYRYAREEIRHRDTEVAIARVKQAIERFRLDIGRCPESVGELIRPPLSQKHYLQSTPKDGWGRPLSIRCPGYFGEEADVISAGPSGSLLIDDNVQ